MASSAKTISTVLARMSCNFPGIDLEARAMGCVVCRLPNVKEVNLILLQREGRRTGAIQELAAKLHIRRETLWRHRKMHLMGKLAPTRAERTARRSRLNFRERAWELSEELRRLQMLIENGAPESATSPAIKVLAMRKGLLEMECRLDSGKGLDAMMKQAKRTAAVIGPEEAERITKEYMAVCLAPELTWEQSSDEKSDGDVDAGVVEAADAGNAAT
jgi:hypothetical protein